MVQISISRPPRAKSKLIFMATKIVLVRHGQTDYNVARRMQGQMNTPLNATGRAQAAAVGAALAARCADCGIVFDAQVTSPLRRARSTGLAIRSAIGPSLERLALHELPGLMERSGGKCEDLLMSSPEFKRLRALGTKSGFETMESLTARAVAALGRAAELSRPGGSGWVLGTTHGGVLAALALAATAEETGFDGAWGAPPNCCIATFEITPRDGGGPPQLRMLAPGFEELIPRA